MWASMPGYSCGSWDSFVESVFSFYLVGPGGGGPLITLGYKDLYPLEPLVQPRPLFCVHEYVCSCVHACVCMFWHMCILNAPASRSQRLTWLPRLLSPYILRQCLLLEPRASGFASLASHLAPRVPVLASKLRSQVGLHTSSAFSVTHK